MIRHLLGRNRNLKLLSIGLLGLVLAIKGLVDIIGSSLFIADVQKKFENGENDITIMSSSEYSKGQNVYGSVLYLYDCFCEETYSNTVYGIETSSNITGSYFLMPIISENEEEEKYITILIKNQDSLEQMYAIVDDTYDYLDGKDVEWHEFFIIGKVKPLEDDVLPFMIDWFEAVEWFDSYDDATISKYVVPYQIEEYDPYSILTRGKIILAFGLVFIVFVVIFFIIALKKPVAQQSIQPMEYNNTPTYDPILNNVPNISQPASADEFFSKPIERNPPPAPVEPQPVAVVSESSDTGMNDLNTSSLNLDSLEDATESSSFNSSDSDMNDLDSSDVDIDSLGSYYTDVDEGEFNDSDIESL